MSRDLSFWKVKGVTRVENKEIYVALSNEVYLPFIEDIPHLKILEDFKNSFVDWDSENEGHYYQKGKESFELMATSQFIRTDCYEMTEHSMNKIIDILYSYNCPLYDSSIDIRFDTF